MSHRRWSAMDSQCLLVGYSMWSPPLSRRSAAQGSMLNMSTSPINTRLRFLPHGGWETIEAATAEHKKPRAYVKVLKT